MTISTRAKLSLTLGVLRCCSNSYSLPLSSNMLDLVMSRITRKNQRGWHAHHPRPCSNIISKKDSTCSRHAEQRCAFDIDQRKSCIQRSMRDLRRASMTRLGAGQQKYQCARRNDRSITTATLQKRDGFKLSYHRKSSDHEENQTLSLLKVGWRKWLGGDKHTGRTSKETKKPH